MKERLLSAVRRWPHYRKDLITNGLVFGIIIAGVIGRVTIYGDLGLSVGHTDTHAYIESSEVNLFSWKAFTSDLPFTTNLIYQLFKPDGGYQLGRVSSIETGTISRRDRPGFHDVAILQSVLSILAWSSLAWIFASKLASPFPKILASIMIVLFGFTPQIVDWDSILGTESLSISLFVLAFAILIELAFRITHDLHKSTTTIALFLVFYVSIFLWTFVRDVNPYALVFLPLLILGTSVIPKFRTSRFLLVAGLLVTMLFIIGVISVRQRPPIGRNLNHIWEVDIMPFPARAQFFTERGMPEQTSPEFQDWFTDHADYTYMWFLLAHPVYTISNYFEDMNYAFLENMQPYFVVRDNPFRKVLILFGNYFHPISPSVFLIVTIIIVFLIAATCIMKLSDTHVWLWLIIWPYLTAAVTLFLSIFGVPLGLHRHALSSTVTFRLLMWCLLIVLIDIGIRRNGLNQNSLTSTSSSTNQTKSQSLE